MPPKVEFHFDFGSPNAYLCHKVLPSIAARTGVQIAYIPVLLGGVFKLTNNQPPMVQFKGIKNKSEYARLETDGSSASTVSRNTSGIRIFLSTQCRSCAATSGAQRSSSTTRCSSGRTG